MKRTEFVTRMTMSTYFGSQECKRDDNEEASRKKHTAESKDIQVKWKRKKMENVQ